MGTMVDCVVERNGGVLEKSETSEFCSFMSHTLCVEHSFNVVDIFSLIVCYSVFNVVLMI